MEQTRELRLTQGEILRILVIRDGRSADELAKLMGYNSYTYLSRLYLRKELTMTQIETASKSLDVHPDIFEVQSIQELTEMVRANETRIKEIEISQAYQNFIINQLEKENKLLFLRLDECEDKRRILERAKN